MLVVMIGLAPLCRLLALAALNPLAAYVLFPCRMDALFIGVLVAWLNRQPEWVSYLRQSRLLRYATVVLWAGLAAMTARGMSAYNFSMQTVGYSWIAATFGATLLLIVLRDQKTKPPSTTIAHLAIMGIGAYSLYLFHMPVIDTLAFIDNLAARALVATPLLAITAVACWFFVERPLIQFYQRTLRYQRWPTDSTPRKHQS